eukprot:COSAG06_NODE_6321_length_2984_cov_1.050260_2_plen_95_part_00
MELLEKLCGKSSGCAEALALSLHSAIVSKYWDAVQTFELITEGACCEERDKVTGKFPLQEALEAGAPMELLERIVECSSPGNTGRCAACTPQSV